VTALAVRELQKSFGGLQVTSRVNLAVEPGARLPADLGCIGEIGRGPTLSGALLDPVEQEGE